MEREETLSSLYLFGGVACLLAKIAKQIKGKLKDPRQTQKELMTSVCRFVMDHLPIFHLLSTKL